MGMQTQGTWRRYAEGGIIHCTYCHGNPPSQICTYRYVEGPLPVPDENFPADKDFSLDNNAIQFNQAEEVSYNYSSSKEAGWNVAVESERGVGAGISTLIAPLGFGIEIVGEVNLSARLNWE